MLMIESTGRPMRELECAVARASDATIHSSMLEPRRENGYGEIHISSCLMQSLARYAVLFALLLRFERPSDERLKNQRTASNYDLGEFERTP